MPPQTTLVPRVSADMGQVTPSLVTTSSTHSADLLEAVMGYENPDLLHRFKTKLGLNEEDARLLFDDTMRFLFLSGTVPGRWGPPEAVDAGWHEFLMFTKDYREFCERYFGRFIDHNPRRLNDTVPQDGGRPRKTLAAMHNIFGSNLSKNWVFANLKVGDKDVVGPNGELQFVAMDVCDSCGCTPCD